jgi:hypothetical protein
MKKALGGRPKASKGDKKKLIGKVFHSLRVQSTVAVRGGSDGVFN